MEEEPSRDDSPMRVAEGERQMMGTVDQDNAAMMAAAQSSPE